MAGQATIMNNLLGQTSKPVPEMREGGSAADQQAETAAFAQALGSLESAQPTSVEDSEMPTSTEIEGSETTPDTNESDKRQSLNLQDQLRMGASALPHASESIGLHGLVPTGVIYDGPESKRQKGIETQLQELSRLQEQKNSTLPSTPVEQTSFPSQAQEYDEERLAKLAKTRQLIRQMNNGPVSGANQSLELHTEQRSSKMTVSDEGLMERQLRDRQQNKKRQDSIARQVFLDRQRKRAQMQQAAGQPGNAEMANVKESRDENRYNELSGQMGE